MYQDKIGKGVTSFDVEKMYTQGSLKLTGVSYDMALTNNGFFQVSDGKETYYTRAGNFRMGESGALEDVGQNKVQGWAISPVTEDSIKSTDSNASYFTNDFSKLLGNKIIRDTASIETIVTKATDYSQTATSDSNTIYTGAGWKTASTKVADVEALITEYNSALTIFSEADPKPTASTSLVQKDRMDFSLDAAVLADGDELYAYIDGQRHSQSFDTDNETTMAKFIDKLSDTPGFTARMVDFANTGNNVNTQSTTGEMVIESLIPGLQYRITEFGWTDASNSNSTTKGALTSIQQRVRGTGMGHIESIEKSLAETVSGKQMDVYTSADITFDGVLDYTYQIDIYDKEIGTNVTIPANPIPLDNMADLDALVAEINNISGGATTDADITELGYYVKAYNINNNLVIKTLDKNNDVEFTGALKGAPVAAAAAVAEIQTFTVDTADDGAAAGNGIVTVAGVNITIADNATIDDIGNAIAGGTYASPIDTVTYDATSDTVTVTYLAGTDEADVVVTSDADTSAAFSAITTAVTGSPAVAATDGTIVKDPNYSGREGAGAEFLQIKTIINQTASKSDLQLRLDTLGLTDSAFGNFNVDSTGLITMTQDGAMFAIGQVAVAKFTDNRGLDPIGDNLLKETTRSGSAIFNLNNSKTADIKGGTLELSTANLSESLVNLMVFQRAFEANAKSITTADQILTTLIQLKR